MTEEHLFRQAYWDDPAARRAFNDFLHLIHGLDLKRWEQAGYWDELYRPFSYFDQHGRVLASVCLYTMNMQVEGKRCRAAQISGVGTLPELRRRGLNRRLTEIALDWAERDHDFVFLFSDVEAIPFYRALGFRSVPESQPYIRVGGGDPVSRPRRLDMSDRADRALVERFAHERSPVSDRLGVFNPKLLMFHALYTMAEDLYHLPALDALICCRLKWKQLVIHDVIARQMPTFAELYPHVRAPEVEEVIFSFMPDRLELAHVDWRPYPDNQVFDRGDLPLRAEPYLFPFTAHA